MTAIDCLIEEHRRDVSEALERGWGPWRLIPWRGIHVLQTGAETTGHRRVSLNCSEATIAGANYSASDVGHLLNALRDCSYARSLGAGPWAKEGEE